MTGLPGQINTRMTIGQALRLVVSRGPRRVALVAGDERITYAQLLERAQTLAASLAALGVRPGDRIAALLWSDADLVYLFFAAAELGAVLALLPPRMRRQEMEGLVREIEACVVVSSTELEVQQGITTLKRLQTELPTLRHIILTDVSQGDGPRWREMLAGPIDADAPVTPPTDPRELLIILCTSGTTGRAKGVMHSHRSLIAPVVASIALRQAWMRWPTLRSVGRWLRPLMRYGVRLLHAVGRQQVFLSTIAMHTIAGLESMLQALLMGDRLVLLPRFHPVQALGLIERERVTVLIAVPVAYATMMRTRDFDRYRLSSLLIAATGAAPCPPALAREIQRRFGCAVHIGFGLTEVGGGIAATSLEDSPEIQAETVGQPMPGMEIRIVDERRLPLPPGQVGELACRSEGLMLGYFGRGTDAGEVIDDEGWLYTGDLATMDERGFVRIVGRKKDMIIRGGQNIHPARIEHCLEEHPAVREAAAVGVPDVMGGEAVWAFVVATDGATIAAPALLDHCRASLEPYEVPQEIRFHDRLPRTANGKVQKFILQEAASKQADHDVTETP